MSNILPGRYLSNNKTNQAYINIGNRTFKDNLNFIKSNNTLKLERIQRRYDTLFKRFVKYERNTISLNYLDENNKQLGGKVKVNTDEINFSLLRHFNYSQYGYFTNDRLVFAKFNTNEDLFEEGEKLSQIINENIEETNMIMRHNFFIENDSFVYKVEVNPKLIQAHHEEIELGNNVTSSELLPALNQTWTEKLLYNVKSI